MACNRPLSRQLLVVGWIAAVSTIASGDPAKSPPAAASLRPLLIVPSQAESTSGFILACVQSTTKTAKIVSGKACAALLVTTKVVDIPLESIEQGARHAVKLKAATVQKGWPCPGPIDAASNRQPYLTLDRELELDSFVVPRGVALQIPDPTDPKTEPGVQSAVKHAAARQKVRPKGPKGSADRFAPQPVALIDLDGDGLSEIVIRDTELYLLYTHDGKPLPGEVGCYFPG
jgi:hypothetical protein